MGFRRLPAALLMVAALAACSSGPSTPPPTAPVDTDVEPATLFSSIGESRFFVSDSVPGLVAATCSGAPSLTVTDPALLDQESLPSGALLDGDKLTLTDDGTLKELPLRSGWRLRLRCLPEGFPSIEVTGRFSTPLALTAAPTMPDGRPWRMLLEPNGFPIWFESVPGALADFTVTERGLLTFTAGARPINSFTNIAGLGFHEVGFDGSELRSWVPSEGFGLDNHGAVITPSGTLLALRYDLVEGGLPGLPVLPAQAQEGRATCPERAPTADDLVLRGRVVELDTTGKVLREWRIEDHLPFAASSAEWVNVAEDPADLRCAVDAEHLNAVEFYPKGTSAAGTASGHVLITGRHMDGAAMIDWPSGEVLWTLGGHQGEKALQILDDPSGGPQRPHDANLIDDDHVLLYDNRIGEPSRALIYRLDDATATLVGSSTVDCAGEPCAAFAMGSSRPVLTDGATSPSSVVVGLGTASTTAAELPLEGFRFGGSPLAGLVLGESWAYRVLPVRNLDVLSVINSQLTGR